MRCVFTETSRREKPLIGLVTSTRRPRGYSNVRTDWSSCVPQYLADASRRRADIEIGASMANAFESSRSDKSTAAQAYQRFLQADRELETLLKSLPTWLKPGATTDGMPPCVVVCSRSS